MSPIDNSCVLVIEDEEDPRELIAFNLSRDGFRVVSLRCGEEALEAARMKAPDLVLLDLMLPGLSGHEVCRMLKSDPALAEIPIIIVTARGEEADVVTGLDLGADDYVTKPFSPKVLLARVRAVLRRWEPAAEPNAGLIIVGEISLDPNRREATVSGQPVVLTSQEFDLLYLLAKRPGWVFTRGQIVTAVRGDDYPVTERAVDVQLVGLRKKLGSAAEYIETVRGVGYRFAQRIKA